MKKPRKFITVTNSAKTFFRVSGKPDPDLSSLKPSRDQDRDNDILYNPISSAVFELLSKIHTDRQTS